MITVHRVDTTNLYLEADEFSDLLVIDSEFKFRPHGFQFMLPYKKGVWDGWIHLFDTRNRALPVGLLDRFIKVCENNSIEYTLNDDVLDLFKSDDVFDVSKYPVNIGGEIVAPYDYQLEAVQKIVDTNRGIILSPTGCLDPSTKIEALIDDDSVEITFDEMRALFESGHNVQVRSPDGYDSVLDVYEKHGPGIEIFLDDGYSFKGASNHLVKVDGEWMKLEDVSVGMVLGSNVVTSTQIVEQQNWIDFTINREDETYTIHGIEHHNSGKSAVIYLLIRHWLDSHNKKVLLIVPNVSLVNQMESDVLDYASQDTKFSEDDIHIIKGGTDKNADKRVYISTWQSLAKIDDEEYFNQFGSVLVDECHGAKGTVLAGIINTLNECEHKVGLTGTLSADESKISELQLIALFGPVHKTITTRELIDAGKIADMRIESVLLDYSDEDKKNCKKLTYKEEIDWVTTHPKRDFFISKLASLQKGNTIVLFNFIKHGKALFEQIKEMCPDQPVFFISGEVDGDLREEIRHSIEDHDDAIIVGNISVVGTGISIKKLHSMILAHPTKSRIRILQAVGRMLRKHHTKDKAVVYDIADDLHWKKHQNHGLKHYKKRIKYYAQEKLDYTLKKINMG